MAGTAVAPSRTEKPTSGTTSDVPWHTVLFNCDCHSFEDVEKQLIKAIRCGLAAARNFAWEVHSKGSAVVFTGPRERCEAVAGVLEDIGLIVKVSQ